MPKMLKLREIWSVVSKPTPVNDTLFVQIFLILIWFFMKQLFLNFHFFKCIIHHYLTWLDNISIFIFSFVHEILKLKFQSVNLLKGINEFHHYHRFGVLVFHKKTRQFRRYLELKFAYFHQRFLLNRLWSITTRMLIHLSNFQLSIFFIRWVMGVLNGVSKPCDSLFEFFRDNIEKQLDVPA